MYYGELWHTKVNYSEMWCTMAHFGVLLYSMPNSSLLWCTMVNCSVLRRTMVSYCKLRCTRCTNCGSPQPWCIMVKCGVLWCTLLYYGVLHSGAQTCMLPILLLFHKVDVSSVEMMLRLSDRCKMIFSPVVLKQIPSEKKHNMSRHLDKLIRLM